MNLNTDIESLESDLLEGLLHLVKVHAVLSLFPAYAGLSHVLCVRACASSELLNTANLLGQLTQRVHVLAALVQFIRLFLQDPRRFLLR